MIPRTSGFYLIAYVLIFIGGIGYIIDPSPSVMEQQRSAFALVWGLFYAVGGFAGAVIILLRLWFSSRTLSLWWYEVGALILIGSSNAIYILSLVGRALSEGNISPLALATILLAYTISLLARGDEILTLIRYANQFAVDREDSDQVHNG